METLPEEMVDAVAVYLSLPDLEACCLVSRRWREIFNRDIVWRHHSCNPTKAEHLRQTPSVVQPHFKLPEHTEATLSPICDQRVNILLEKRLWSNWQEGRFEKSTIVNEVLNADRISFLTNDYLVLLSKNKITLWNVHDDSSNGFFEPVKLSSNQKVNMCKTAAKDKVVVVQGYTVYIFLWDLCSIQWYFQCAFCFNESDNKLFRNLEAIRFPRVRIKFCYFEVFGNYFFGCLLGQAIFHVWDIEKCRKLKEQAMPTSDIICIKGFQQSETQKRHILIPTTQCQEDQCFMTVCYVYDLINLTFLPFQAIVRHEPSNETLRVSQCLGFLGIHGKYVFIADQNKLHIFSIGTNQSLPIVVGPIQGAPQVFNDSFVFLSSKTVRAYDPSKMKLTTVIDKVAFFRGLMNIGNKFCITYHKRCNALFSEVWSVNNKLQASEAKTKLFYWNPGYILSNESCTVLLFVGESEGRLCKLCFW